MNPDAWPILGQAARVRRDRLGGPHVRYEKTARGLLRVRAQPSSRGPRLLFGTDMPNVVEHYDDLLAELEGKGDVIVFEPPGTGGSAPTRDFDFGLASLAAVTEELLAQTGPRTLVFPCYLGLVAQLVARRSPRLAPRVVLPQTVGAADFQRWADRVDPRRLLRTPVAGQLVVAARRRAIARGWYAASVGHVERLSSLSATADRALAAGGCYCLASLMQRLEADLHGLDLFPRTPLPVPSAIVWGARDRTHKRSDPTRALPGAQVVRFEESGHCADLEEPARFAAWLLDRHARTQ
jgi:pimeloyl-ACP methyl ester carboxylesterase